MKRGFAFAALAMALLLSCSKAETDVKTQPSTITKDLNESLDSISEVHSNPSREEEKLCLGKAKLASVDVNSRENHVPLPRGVIFCSWAELEYRTFTFLYSKTQTCESNTLKDDFFTDVSARPVSLSNTPILCAQPTTVVVKEELSKEVPWPKRTGTETTICLHDNIEDQSTFLFWLGQFKRRYMVPIRWAHAKDKDYMVFLGDEENPWEEYWTETFWYFAENTEIIDAQFDIEAFTCPSL